MDLKTKAEILGTNYKMEPMNVNDKTDTIEGDVKRDADNETLMIEVSVNDRVNLVNIQASKIKKDLDFRDVTKSYRTRPEVTKLLDDIRKDLGLL
jgi:hypothetical protein